MLKTITKKYLAAFSACAFLSFVSPIATQAAGISLTTSASPTVIGSSTANWSFSGITSPESIGSIPDTLNGNFLTNNLGTFTYGVTGGPNPNVTDISLTITPDVGGDTTNLTFHGTLNLGFLQFNVGPDNPGAVTVNTDYTALAFDGYYFGVDNSFLLNVNATGGKTTPVFGYVTTASTAVPEPASAGMIFLAGFGLLAFGWKRKLFASKQ